MGTMIVLTDAERCAAQLQWGQRLARVWSSDRLTVLFCMFGAPSEPAPPSGARAPGPPPPGVIPAVVEQVELLTDIPTELLLVRDPAPVASILREIDTRGIHHLAIAVDDGMLVGSAQAKLVDQLLRRAMCEAIVLDIGPGDHPTCRRAAIAMGRAAGGALKLASALLDEGGVLAPFLVVPEFSADAERMAHQELAIHLRAVDLDQERHAIEPTVVLADRFATGALQAIDGADLVVMPGRGGKALRELRTAERTMYSAQETVSPVMAVYRRARIRRGLHLGVRDAIVAWLPDLVMADRIALFDRIQTGAQWSPDIAIMMGLAALIASMGLIVNSIPVIIGAMLVAPLMTPLVGIGLALVQGNSRLFRRSLTATVAGVATGLILSLFVGWISLGDDLPMEVVLRSEPHLLDLVIALLSGMAGAYAFARSSVTEAIAGVAIAAALVPPLAAAGIAASHADVLVAQGALILLITNLVAIVLGAAIVFSVLGAKGQRVLMKKTRWARGVVLGLCILIVLLLEPLGVQLAQKINVGYTTPHTYPVSRRVRKAVMARVQREGGVSLISMGRLSSEAQTDVRITLIADRPVGPELTRDIKRIIHSIRGPDVRVHVFVLQQASIEDKSATKPSRE